MKTGICQITIPFSQEVNEMHHEYQVTKLDGTTPSYISFAVNKGSRVVVRGNKRIAESGFVFEVTAELTDQERDTIYTQVSVDLKEIIVLSESINLNTPE